MTYLDTLLHVGGVFWLVAFGLAAISTFASVLNHDEEKARVTATAVVSMLIITAFASIAACAVWLEERQQFEESSHD